MNVPNLSGLVIRGMSADDLAFATECTSAEGWVSENYTTLEGFFLHDPATCLIAEERRQRVGMCIATDYGDSGFIGELIVLPAARGMGVGARLLNLAVGVLKERGVETVYLDGVVHAVPLYERNGFHKICRSWRFSGRLAGKHRPAVRRMQEGDLESVFSLDREAFGADRSFYLRRRQEIYPDLCYVMSARETLTGYIMGRGEAGWVAAGPWVVAEGTQHPLDLLTTLAVAAGERSISLGVLDCNQQACILLHSIGFTGHLDSPWRMALGNCQGLGASRSCFAVGSAAKG